MKTKSETKERGCRRTTIVLSPEDEKIIELIKTDLGFVTRTKAIRYGLRKALENLEYELISKSYLREPETKQELEQSKAILRKLSTGLEKEKW